MTAPRFNGEAANDLKNEAERLRGLYEQNHGANKRNFTLHPELDGFTVGDTHYLRYPDGKFRDGQGTEFDPASLVIPVEPEHEGLWEYPLEALDGLDFTTLADNPRSRRQWAVDQWLPMLETVGLGGPGGEGKTLIAQMMGTAAALGRICFGLDFEKPMKTALVLCEDRPNDAHWRQVDINKYFNCSMRSLAGKLKIYPRRSKQHNYLAVFDKDDALHLTPFFFQLLEDLKAFGAKFVVIDTRADVFFGNQNSEQHARTFVRKVTDRLAEELGGIVILLYQPSRAGRPASMGGDGSGESGSVQWDSAFRCRLLLNPANTFNGEDPAIRHFVRKKSNFSFKDEEIVIRWDQGVFISEEEHAARQPAVPGYEIAARNSQARTAFLACLGKFAKQGRRVSPQPTAGNYAPKIFARLKEAKGCPDRALETAMNDLYDDEVIATDERGGHIVKVVPKSETEILREAAEIDQKDAATTDNQSEQGSDDAHCEHCGGPLTSALRKGSRRFCSDRCKKASRRGPLTSAENLDIANPRQPRGPLTSAENLENTDSAAGRPHSPPLRSRGRDRAAPPAASAPPHPGVGSRS
jgi:RecA-family ATPase